MVSISLFEAIGAILAADLVLLIAYLVNISPKHESVTEERKNLLDERLEVKIDESKKGVVSIESFLPYFREYETIQKWRRIFKQTCAYLGYSIFLTLVALFFSLAVVTPIIGSTTFDVLFLVGGGLYFLVGLIVIIKHAIEVNEWKASKKKIVV